jgi:nitrogen fixation protein FixH
MKMEGDMTNATHTGGLKGWHVLAAFLGFFGVVFAANGVFLYSALSTYTGVVANEPYRKGLQYNDRIAAGEIQDQLGWVADVTVDREPGRITLIVKDKAGQPVSGLRVAGVFGRPSTNRHDIKLTLREVETGRYVMDVGTLEAGSWIATVEAAWPFSETNEPVYRLRKRLWLKS